MRAAQVVNLRYVSDESPGIRRKRAGAGFRYRDSSNALVRDAATLRRIAALAIPPAWTDVWICSDPNGHLQATGRDERGRKQFRYHARWREIRDETKYARILVFARALPRIRRRINKDLAAPGLPRRKVLATVVRLLELSLIRIGNEEYARENESFGLTTLRDRHVAVRGDTLRFHFRGKSGRWHEVDVHDRRLARIVKRCQDLPGQELFQFMGDDGERHEIRSDDVNEYLREISGEDFTAKDFRTWSGTVLAMMALREIGGFANAAAAKRNVVAAVSAVARRLGNTPAVCRKCYIHPHVLQSYLEGTLATGTNALPEKSAATLAFGDWRRHEPAVLKLLQRQLTLEQKLARALRRETASRSRARDTTAGRPQSAPRK